MTLPLRATPYHPKPNVVPMCVRIARARRTTEDDGKLKTADETRIRRTQKSSGWGQ